jgi:two-component system, OmpR family, alkaline phosphatase synthesis response regulator PhoP
LKNQKLQRSWLWNNPIKKGFNYRASEGSEGEDENKILIAYLIKNMPKKIVVIEDEEIMINLLQKKLSQNGYEVSIARDGQEGLDLMRKIMPDLVLLDIIMPKMGGFEVMEEMRQDEKLKEIPVIIVSNSGQPVEIDKARESGAKDWLIKTEFDPQEVIDKVKKQIG